MESKEEVRMQKKCFCARCFKPILKDEDKTTIDGQNFHKMCSICCVCQKVPKSLKMFYGRVFCSDCFKARMLNRCPMMHAPMPNPFPGNDWWVQCAPSMEKAPVVLDNAPSVANNESADLNNASPAVDNAPPVVVDSKEAGDVSKEDSTANVKEGYTKKPCLCARCQRAIGPNSIKVEVDGQSFHAECAKCCYCHETPKNNLKIYYGQVFCEKCFNEHVLSEENPSKFFQHCFQQWQNNPHFAACIKDFLANQQGNASNAAPLIFVMPNPSSEIPVETPTHAEWMPTSEPNKSKTSTPSMSCDGWDLSFENKTEASDVESGGESAKKEVSPEIETIRKLTKYLDENDLKLKSAKKLKNLCEERPPHMHERHSLMHESRSLTPSASKSGKRTEQWIKPKRSLLLDHSKSLWQRGPIFVSSIVKKNVSGDK